MLSGSEWLERAENGTEMMDTRIGLKILKHACKEPVEDRSEMPKRKITGVSPWCVIDHVGFEGMVIG